MIHNRCYDYAYLIKFVMLYFLHTKVLCELRFTASVCSPCHKSKNIIVIICVELLEYIIRAQGSGIFAEIMPGEYYNFIILKVCRNCILVHEIYSRDIVSPF